MLLDFYFFSLAPESLYCLRKFVNIKCELKWYRHFIEFDLTGPRVVFQKHYNFLVNIISSICCCCCLCCCCQSAIFTKMLQSLLPLLLILLFVQKQYIFIFFFSYAAKHFIVIIFHRINIFYHWNNPRLRFYMAVFDTYIIFFLSFFLFLLLFTLAFLYLL